MEQSRLKADTKYTKWLLIGILLYMLVLEDVLHNVAVWRDFGACAQEI